jgi:hypothetical protein
LCKQQLTKLKNKIQRKGAKHETEDDEVLASVEKEMELHTEEIMFQAGEEVLVGKPERKRPFERPRRR